MKVSPEIESLIPYSPGKPIDETKREYGLDEVVKLASNENPLGPSPKVLEALSRAAQEIHRYPDAGAYELAQKASQFFGFESKNMVFGNGSNELIDLLVRVFCEPGDAIMTTKAAFIAYKICAQAARVKTVEIPYDENLVFDLKALGNELRDSKEKTKLVFIPNPNNPTGTYIGRSEVESFLSEFGGREDMLIVFDEAYSEYTRAEDMPNALDYVRDYKNVIALRTLSKAYGLAALRVGILFAHESHTDFIQRVRMPFNVSSLAQDAAVAALDDQDYVKRTVELTWQGLDYFYGEFEKLGLKYYPSQGNFVLVDTGRDALQVYEEMLKRGVIVRPLKGYGFSTELRFSVGLVEENQKAIEALKGALS